METKKRRWPTVVLIIFILVVAALYVYLYLMPEISGSLTPTYIVQYASVQKTDDAHCIVVRDESVVKAGHTGSISYYSKETEKTRKGFTVADIYSGNNKYSLNCESTGFISYYLDSYEDFFNPSNLGSLDLEQYCDFDVALELVRTSTLFTTHTPVPAGHDAFEEHLLRTYMPHYAHRMNISWERFMGLGRFNPNNTDEKFSMSVLATNMSQEVNGVSRIHGRVSRDMFKSLWPGYFAEENHIGYVTNGVHLPTWGNRLWQRLYKQTFGADYIEHQSDEKVWEKIYGVAD